VGPDFKGCPIVENYGSAGVSPTGGWQLQFLSKICDMGFLFNSLDPLAAAPRRGFA
jgi:hypothetical protein